MLLFGAKRVVNITPPELQQRLEKGEKPQIIDVREPWEYKEGHIPGSILRPLGQIRIWSKELNQDDEIVLLCRTGARSETAFQYLQAAGFKNLKNVRGGIVDWRGPVEH